MLDSCLYLAITTFAATRVVLLQILKFASFRSLNRARTHTQWLLVAADSNVWSKWWNDSYMRGIAAPAVRHPSWCICSSARAATCFASAFSQATSEHHVNTVWTPAFESGPKVDMRRYFTGLQINVLFIAFQLWPYCTLASPASPYRRNESVAIRKTKWRSLWSCVEAKRQKLGSSEASEFPPTLSPCSTVAAVAAVALDFYALSLRRLGRNWEFRSILPQRVMATCQPCQLHDVFHCGSGLGSISWRSMAAVRGCWTWAGLACHSCVQMLPWLRPWRTGTILLAFS